MTLAFWFTLLQIFMKVFMWVGAWHKEEGITILEGSGIYSGYQKKNQQKANFKKNPCPLPPIFFDMCIKSTLLYLCGL